MSNKDQAVFLEGNRLPVFLMPPALRRVMQLKSKQARFSTSAGPVK